MYMDDSEIVDLYLSRDESAISHTAFKYGSRLKRIAFRILNSTSSAEECENDTYLEAWNRIPPSEPRTYLFPFLGRIIRHLAIDEYRKNLSQKRNALFSELTLEMEQCIPGRNTAEEAFDADALAGTINSYLSTLSEEQRGIFIRRYWFFDSILEISVRYGCSTGKVKTNLFRMREGLKKYLEKEGYTV